MNKATMNIVSVHDLLMCWSIFKYRPMSGSCNSFPNFPKYCQIDFQSDYTNLHYSYIFRMLSFVPVSLRLSPPFSSFKFCVSGFMLIHLNLRFVLSDIHGSICFLLLGEIHLNQHHLLKMLYHYHHMILPSLSKIKFL